MNRPDPDSRIPWLHVFLLGLAAGFLSLAPAILPWGGRFVTRGDFIEQQLPFLLEARRILRGGLNAYSFSKALLCVPKRECKLNDLFEITVCTDLNLTQFYFLPYCMQFASSPIYFFTSLLLFKFNPLSVL